MSAYCVSQCEEFWMQTGWIRLWEMGKLLRKGSQLPFQVVLTIPDSVSQFYFHSEIFTDCNRDTPSKVSYGVLCFFLSWFLLNFLIACTCFHTGHLFFRYQKLYFHFFILTTLQSTWYFISIKYFLLLFLNCCIVALCYHLLLKKTGNKRWFHWLEISFLIKGIIPKWVKSFSFKGVGPITFEQYWGNISQNYKMLWVRQRNVVVFSPYVCHMQRLLL